MGGLHRLLPGGGGERPLADRSYAGTLGSSAHRALARTALRHAEREHGTREIVADVATDAPAGDTAAENTG